MAEVKLDSTASWLSPSILDEIMDPVLNEPLEEAQEVDCGVGTPYGGHILSLKTVQRLFQNPTVEARCPVCERKITKSIPNPAVQRLVNAIIVCDKGEKHVAKIYKIIKERKLQQEVRDAWLYPLSGTSFTCEQPQFEDNNFFATFTNSEERRGCLKNFYIVKQTFLSLVKIDLGLSFYEVEQQIHFKTELEKHKIRAVDISYVNKQNPDQSRLCLAIGDSDQAKLFEVLQLIRCHNMFDVKARRAFDFVLAGIQDRTTESQGSSPTSDEISLTHL